MSGSSPNHASRSPSPLDRATRKAFWRLLPLLFLCYVIAYVDRANVGYAKLTMQSDLPSFTNEVIGFGSGVFFLGYFLLEIPGTLLVEKWSARKWIARIMITWGVIAAITAFVKTPPQFYGIRFLLGLAEAGFFPGVIVYLTHWFPRATRARAMAIFLIGTPVAQLASPKVCNLLLKIGTPGHPHLLGLSGWQWVYIGWGIPAVLLGILVLLYLPDRPRHARWLTPEERDALEADLEADRASRPPSHHISVLASLRHPKVILLAGVLFTISASNYALETFLPTILKKWYGLSTDSVTTLLLLPPVCALLGQLAVAWSSDRTGERRIHAAVCTFLAGLGFATAPLTHGMLPLTLACFMLYATGNKASQVPFWALPSLMLTGSAAAASTGLINSLGNLGGFVGPYALGYLETHSGSFIPGLYVLGALLIVASISLVLLKLTHAPISSRGFPVTLPDDYANGLTTSSPATTLPGKSSE